MKRILVERDNGEIEEIEKLPRNEYYEFLVLMQKILFAQAILNTIVENEKNQK